MTLLHVAIKQPDRLTAMVLDGATHSFSDNMRNEIAKTVADIKSDSGGFYSEIAPLHHRGKDQVDDLLEHFFEFSRSRGMQLNEQDLNSISVRTLVMLGDRDEYFPVESAVKMMRQLPNSSLSVLPNRRHTLTTEEALEIANIAKQFYSQTKEGD